MATVFIPTLLQTFTKGTKRVNIPANNVRHLVNQLEEMFPGIQEGLLEDGEILPNICVAVDGDITQLGLLEQLEEDSEVHFVPAIGGGCVQMEQIGRLPSQRGL